MSVTRISPTLYRQLQITNPLERKKSVSFTDLNEIKTFQKHEPPIWVSGRPVEDILRERIRYLETKLDRYTQDKENRQMIPARPAKLERPSLVPTERSVTSPFKPVQPKAPAPARNDAAWQSNPVQLAHPPANIQRALAAQPVAAPRPAPPALAQAPIQPRKPIPSRTKRFFGGLGAILAGPGTVAGFLSIAVLGPIGIGVAAAFAATGALCIWASSKMK